MAKRPRKPSKTYYAPSQLAMRRMQDALVKYDEAVTKLEVKWGVDRLPWLVGHELRERFDAQMDKLNKAIEAGHQPLTGEYWEAPMPGGKVLAIVRTGYEVGKVKRENREMVVCSVEEVAKMVQAQMEQIPAVEKAKDLWPGATVEKIKTATEKELNDEIPF